MLPVAPGRAFLILFIRGRLGVRLEAPSNAVPANILRGRFGGDLDLPGPPRLAFKCVFVFFVWRADGKRLNDVKINGEHLQYRSPY